MKICVLEATELIFILSVINHRGKFKMPVPLRRKDQNSLIISGQNSCPRPITVLQIRLHLCGECEVLFAYFFSCAYQLGCDLSRGHILK